MTLIESRDSPVRKQLEAYGASWKTDHDAAMECRNWEDAVAVGLAVYRILREREAHWRDRVFRGALNFDEADNADHRDRLAYWLGVTDEALADCIAGIEAKFGSVAGAAELRDAATDARIALQTWKRPKLSTLVGLREISLTPEAVAVLDRILAEGKTNPTPMPKGPPMREISEAEFIARTRRV